MNMGKRESGIIYRRLVHSYLSSVISISLVLFLAGVAAMVVANAKSVSDYFKENMKISAELSLSVDEPEALSIMKGIEVFPGVKSVEYISKDQGIRELEQQLGSGFLEVFETPPIPITLEIALKADYMCADSLEVVKSSITSVDGVSDVYYQESLMESLNANIEKAGAVLALFIALLMFISFVLIGNTVRLNLYSKRFTIYAMQLVGATKAFIRRPFMIQAFFQGLLSGLIATVGLVVALLLVKNGFSEVFDAVHPEMIVAVLAGVVAMGIVMCLISTAFVVNRLVGFSRDELYL